VSDLHGDGLIHLGADGGVTVTVKVTARRDAASAGYAITHKHIMTSTASRSILIFVSRRADRGRKKDLIDNEEIDMESQPPRSVEADPRKPSLSKANLTLHRLPTSRYGL